MLKLTKKIKQKLSKTLRLNFCYLKIIHFSLIMLSSKTNMTYTKKCVKNRCICFNKILCLIIEKMRLKMKNGSHGSNTNRTWQDMDTNILNIKCVPSQKNKLSLTKFKPRKAKISCFLVILTEI